MAGASGSERALDQTPTWAVASVCAIIVIISLLLEKVLHHIGKWLTQKRKRALFDALEKIKDELMILGFISLLLTFSQNYIAKICIPSKPASVMLPCRPESKDSSGDGGGKQRRLLLSVLVGSVPTRRMLAGDPGLTKCPEGKEALVSVTALHQLHIFIFFLAVFHVIFSAIMMALGREKIKRWKEWEKETTSLDYQFVNDSSRFRFVEDISFVKQHASFWSRATILLYFVSFFRQFFRSVRKVDYLAMRHGFVSVHLARGSNFDFRLYIKRSLEDDFKYVVGISPVLWASAVIFLLLNVYKWNVLFWVSLIPPVIILAVGTKLQAIITQMALEIQDKHAVIQGTPLVQLGDDRFWFGSPHLVLFLIHFSLFQNAFQITFFLWTWYEYGLRSCFHENFKLIIARISIGVVAQILCSYVTLPLYALVSQMGSHMKRSIFDEEITKALKRWHQTVQKKRTKGSSHSAMRTPGSASPWTSPGASPARSFHRYKSLQNYGGSPDSNRGYFSDHDASHHDGTPSSTLQLIPIPKGASDEPEQHADEHHVHFHDQQHSEQHSEASDFSFRKPQHPSG